MSEEKNDSESSESDDEEYSSESEHGGIVPQDGVVNITYYDSSDEDSDFDVYTSEEEEEEEEVHGEIDEDTRHKLEFLEERLKEIASVIVTGKNCFKVSFYIKNEIELKKPSVKSDFDIDDSKLPVMVLGGEDYLLPFLKMLCKKKKFLTPLHITTNCEKKKYTF
jgi:hypothetical protein